MRIYSLCLSFKTLICPKKHGLNMFVNKWKKHINHEERKTTKFIINNAKFVSFTCDEVTSMDNTSWAMRMIMLCKIGVGYSCCYMSNKCLMDLESTFNFFDQH